MSASAPALTAAASPPAEHLDLVRFRNDGDDFHVLWTARRALRILWPQSNLVAVAVEDISDKDMFKGEKITDGLLVADTTEYYGAETFEDATQIVVNQLKYSTQASTRGWPASGVEDTLKGFAQRYRRLVAEHGAKEVHAKYRFRFVTNRPLSTELEKILDAGRRNNSGGLSKRAKAALTALRKACAMSGSELRDFLGLVEFAMGHASRRDTAADLAREATLVQPALYTDATANLKEMVRSKSTSDTAGASTIRRETVLRAFLVDNPDDLLPAPAKFDPLGTRIAHHQDGDVIDAVMRTEEPLVITATGGIGKSALARAIPGLLPPGSEAVVFDGFAGGAYRNASQQRHLHRVGLVQIVNELAIRGLCYPLLPQGADPHQFIRAFRHRLAQAAETVRARSEDAVVAIILDAADNSQEAALLYGDRSFISDLLGEMPPDHCRIVALCRPERFHLLGAPHGTKRFELEGFNEAETGKFAAQHVGGSDGGAVAEFHRLTFGNPRVQANQLAAATTLEQAIERLGPGGLTVEALIEAQLDAALDELRRTSVGTDVEALGGALAMLPPMVPLSIISTVAGLPEGAVASFAADFAGGRPLMIQGGSAVQFRDEPVETWFRKRFAADPEAADAFARRLEPAARTDFYAASALPGLLYQARRSQNLLTLALGDVDLDNWNPVDRRHIVLNRVRYALKAAIDSTNVANAAKLLFRAGEEAAASDRQSAFLAANADLVARLAGAAVVEDFVFRKRAGTGAWFGSSNAYSAAMFAADPALHSEARSFMRNAERWLEDWSRLPSKSKEDEPLEADDIAALGFAVAMCEGAATGAAFLQRPRPARFAFDIALRTAAKLLDIGEDDLVFALLEKLTKAAPQRLALIAALAGSGTAVPKKLLAATARAIAREGLPDADAYDGIEVFGAAATLAEALAREGLISEARKIVALGAIPLSDHPFPDHRGAISVGLRFALLDEALGGDQVTDERLWNWKGARRYEKRPDGQFSTMSAMLIPFFRFRVNCLLGRAGNPDQELETAHRAAHGHLSFAGDYREREIRSVRFLATVEGLALAGALTSERLAAAVKRLAGKDGSMWPREFVAAMRVAGRIPGLADDCLELAAAAAMAADMDRQDASSTANDYAAIARALLPVSQDDAAVYFSRGIEIADRMGDEVSDRLIMMLRLGDHAAAAGTTAEDAFRLLRSAELMHSINDHKFPWHEVFTTLARMHPAAAAAGASRLESRRKGGLDESLASILAVLSTAGTVGIAVKAAFAPLDGYWRQDDLSEALEPLAPDQREHIVRALAGDAVFFAEASFRMRWLVEAADAFGIDVPDLQAAYAKNRDREDRASSFQPTKRKPPGRSAFRFLAKADLTDAGQISAVFDAYQYGPKAPTIEETFAEMRARVAVTDRTAHVHALAEAEAIELGNLVGALEAIAADWKSSPAVAGALKSAAETVVKTRGRELAASPYQWRSVIPKLAAIAGLSQEKLIRIVTDNAAIYIDELSAGALLSLPARLTAGLAGPQDSLDVLRFVLDRTGLLLTDEDGDGPWTEKMDPGSDALKALAGLLWIQLGSPDPARRWRAAHCVRRLARFGEAQLLERLIGFAAAASDTAYMDPGLPAYGLHSKLFLAIALARAAAEAPAMIAPHAPLLKDWARRSNPHAFIRYHAGRALIALSQAQAITLTPAEIAEIDGLLDARGVPAPARSPREKDDKRRESRFYLSYDFDRRWSDRIGNIFGISPREFEQMVEAVIVDEWKTPEGKDPRIERGLHWGRRRGARDYDTLHDYLSEHAGAVVLGRLLDSHGIAGDRGAESWRWFIQSHTLAMESASWLADRRDPTPEGKAEGIDDYGVRDWGTAIKGSDFEDRLFSASGRLIGWGDWTETEGGRSEHVRIESALVSPENAMDLLRAAQTSEYRWGFLPIAGADGQIRRPGYRLTGWVDLPEGPEGIDRQDVLSGGIRFPPMRPGQAIRRLTRMTADPDERAWSVPGIERPVLYPRVWGNEEPRIDYYERTEGGALEIEVEPLLRFLKRMGRYLIVSVEIRRRERHGQREENEDRNPCFRYFVLRGSGELRWLRGSRSLGPADPSPARRRPERRPVVVDEPPRRAADRRGAAGKRR